MPYLRVIDTGEVKKGHENHRLRMRDLDSTPNIVYSISQISSEAVTTPCATRYRNGLSNIYM